MILAIAALVAVLHQSAPSSPGTMTDEKGRPVSARKTDMKEASAFLTTSFASEDLDHSGFLEPAEASRMEPRDAQRDKSLPPAPPAGQPDPAAEQKWMPKLDTNRDGRVSRDEYIAYMMPWILWQGVPADWRKWAHQPD